MNPNELGRFKTTPENEYLSPEIWEILGTVDVIRVTPGRFSDDDLLLDLQTADDCYTAWLLKEGDVEYVFLIGSGWKSCGFPFCQVDFDPSEPYKTGKGQYGLIRGVAKDRFVELTKNGYVPTYDLVSTGDYKKDFCLAEMSY